MIRQQHIMQKTFRKTRKFFDQHTGIASQKVFTVRDILKIVDFFFTNFVLRVIYMRKKRFSPFKLCYVFFKDISVCLTRKIRNKNFRTQRT